jgi:hypothetical protein
VARGGARAGRRGGPGRAAAVATACLRPARFNGTRGALGGGLGSRGGARRACERVWGLQRVRWDWCELIFTPEACAGGRADGCGAPTPGRPAGRRPRAAPAARAPRRRPARPGPEPRRWQRHRCWAEARSEPGPVSPSTLPHRGWGQGSPVGRAPRRSLSEQMPGCGWGWAGHPRPHGPGGRVATVPFGCAAPPAAPRAGACRWTTPPAPGTPPPLWPGRIMAAYVQMRPAREWAPRGRGVGTAPGGRWSLAPVWASLAACRRHRWARWGENVSSGGRARAALDARQRTGRWRVAAVGAPASTRCRARRRPPPPAGGATVPSLAASPPLSARCATAPAYEVGSPAGRAPRRARPEQMQRGGEGAGGGGMGAASGGRMGGRGDGPASNRRRASPQALRAPRGCGARGVMCGAPPPPPTLPRHRSSPVKRGGPRARAAPWPRRGASNGGQQRRGVARLGPRVGPRGARCAGALPGTARWRAPLRPRRATGRCAAARPRRPAHGRPMIRFHPNAPICDACTRPATPTRAPGSISPQALCPPRGPLGPTRAPAACVHNQP